ncbi:MAG: beta-ketoacyl synthase [Fibrobacteraceae bacterium]|nr:beta-ketoacyl synthase [Fibrobacteraceae bacterium]
MTTRPLYIKDFGFRCILGSRSDVLFDKLKNGIRGNMELQDFAGSMKYAATIPANSLAPINNPIFDNRVNRLTKAALDTMDSSIREAIQHYGASRIGIFLGSCDNGSEASLEALKVFQDSGTFPQGYKLDYQRADFPAQYIAKRYGITGIMQVHSTACASSASAFVSARNNIYAGVCDAAIVGGVDIASLPVVLGFASLEAMSDMPTNPFSKNRSGLTLGDAAAYFLVTRDQVTELSVEGLGESADADHITAPRADGLGAVQTMKAALQDANMDAGDVCYINLHGTGTRLNDAMESRAVNALFGPNTPASSTKALTGHTLGAAGALEAAFCCLALSNDEGFMPAHLFDGVVDDELPEVRLVKPLEKMKNNSKGERIAISNSFAFGGCNVSLVIRSSKKF